VGKSLPTLGGAQFLLNLTLQEINYFQHNASIWQRVKYFANNFDEFLVSVWQYEMFTVSDTVIVEGRSITTQRSVTIGKSVGAMVILIFGLLLVKRIMNRTMQFAMRRTNIRASTLLIFTRWGTLIAGITLIVFSLILVDIPLSIFAFARGALAIGIGFGEQNLLQNLISGLMLLIEKPIRVGDWIEVGGLTGRENIIPNSVLVR
jgi:potassium efflux system protein